MADTKISALSEEATLELEDLLVVVVEPDGTPITKMAPLSKLVTLLNGTYQPLHADLTDLVARWVAASASAPASLALAEDTDNGSNTITITAPAALGGDRVWTLPDATDTAVGVAAAQTLTNKTLEDTGAIEQNVNTVAVSGSTETLDTAVYGVHDVTMDQACTFTFSNPAPSGDNSTFILILRGAFTPTFPASVDWGDAAAPTYTTPSMYVFTTVDGGTTWLGVSCGKAFG